jgi:transposase InsO family protein
VDSACRIGISRKTGYKWIRRAESGKEGWARDQSRRPHASPERVSPEIEQAVLEVRTEHPVWGGRKIRKRLEVQGQATLPAASTITAILRRNDRIEPGESEKHDPLQRFEREKPNELWQMDFKGPVKTGVQGPCHPLTIVDDHSRYAVCVGACADERAVTVQQKLTETFRIYGMPECILCDNGACWGRIESRYSVVGAWLLRLGIRLRHGRPYHPQTQGKNERFNRTLKAECLHGLFHDLADCQRAFDRFRAVYNQERPHEALGLATPASRYSVSCFSFPETLPPIEYLDTDIVRKVGQAGIISYQDTHYQVGRAFVGEPVALRATPQDGVLAVYYCQHQVGEIDLRAGTSRQV